MKTFAVLVLSFLLPLVSLAQDARNTLVPEGASRYHPGPFPDRIVLVVTEAPATSQTVNWRTDVSVSRPSAQIAVAGSGAGLHLEAASLQADTMLTDADNGPAHHHAVTFTGLRPDTLYAYRVRGQDTWSEWFQFRTASEDSRDFSFLYFGDAQNSVKSHFSRVIREANSELPRPALMLHAGDLINQRDGNTDDEWGEWFEAGGFLHAMSPSFPVTGNHEFPEVEINGEERYVMGPHWAAQFRVPANGPLGLQETVYFSRYQGVLFVSLDSTRALQDESIAQAQAQWLDQLLAGDDSRWVIISHHHPIFSVSSGRDNALLRELWKPIYDRHGVDMVLQGHDHTYGRGANLAEGTNLLDNLEGPVYVVSVAGPKQYIVSDEAREQMARVGEDVQLYQIIHVRDERLIFESRTANGALYDAFDLVRQADGSKTLINRGPEPANESLCQNPARPRPTRCWEGTELVD